MVDLDNFILPSYLPSCLILPPLSCLIISQIEVLERQLEERREDERKVTQERKERLRIVRDDHQNEMVDGEMIDDEMKNNHQLLPSNQDKEKDNHLMLQEERKR